MPSIAAAEARLRADSRPVLFLGTCVIVDIIRATMRCMGTNFVQSAIELRRFGYRPGIRAASMSDRKSP